MTIRYVYWQEDDMWLGYLEQFPDYWTQGESLGGLAGAPEGLVQRSDLPGRQVNPSRDRQGAV